MPNTDEKPAENTTAAAATAKPSTGIDVEKPKTVAVNYRNEANEIILSLKVDPNGTLTISDHNLNEAQFKDLRKRISQSLKAR